MGGSIRILGIDPGTVVAGFACVEVAAPRTESVADSDTTPIARRVGNVARIGGGVGRARLVEAGALRLGRNRALPDRLCALARGLDAILQRLGPDELALEEAFFGKSVQSAMRVGEARGVVLAGARARGVAIHQFPPARIKRSVAGHGGADKQTLARMVCRQLGLREAPNPADVTDAMAVALCRVEAIGTVFAESSRADGQDS